MYARQHVKPVLQDIDSRKIQTLYAELRKESQSGGVAVAVRHIESIIRMAEASAKMHLREYVTEADVDVAITVLLNSVIKSQKYAVARQMEIKFRQYLVRKQATKPLHTLLASCTTHKEPCYSLHNERGPTRHSSADRQ